MEITDISPYSFRRKRQESAVARPQQNRSVYLPIRLIGKLKRKRCNCHSRSLSILLTGRQTALAAAAESCDVASENQGVLWDQLRSIVATSPLRQLRYQIPASRNDNPPLSSYRPPSTSASLCPTTPSPVVNTIDDTLAPIDSDLCNNRKHTAAVAAAAATTTCVVCQPRHKPHPHLHVLSAFSVPGHLY